MLRDRPNCTCLDRGTKPAQRYFEPRNSQRIGAGCIYIEDRRNRHVRARHALGDIMRKDLRAARSLHSHENLTLGGRMWRITLQSFGAPTQKLLSACKNFPEYSGSARETAKPGASSSRCSFKDAEMPRSFANSRVYWAH